MKTKALQLKKVLSKVLCVLLLSAVSMTNANAQTGALNGLFTINENGDQVRFSQGNLQYQASTHTWRFAENQWDYVGEDNANISETYDGWIDLFGWGTSGYNHGAEIYQPWDSWCNIYAYSAYGEMQYNLYDQTGQADWGYNPISNGGNVENCGWRTLRQQEWEFVFNERNTASGIRFAKVIMNGVKGVVLLPDNWLASIYSFSNVNVLESDFESNIISFDDWMSNFVARGAVFLPVTGWRVNDTEMWLLDYGFYWTSTVYTDGDGEAKSVSFGDENWFSDSNDLSFRSERCEGCAVRLVRPVEPATHGYIDLGLPSGTLWATCNVGANTPEEYGDYFAWGETQPKDYYDWNNYLYCNGYFNQLTKYCNDSNYGYNDYTDDLSTLLPEDDAATANWGNEWHMPNDEEWQELYDNTNYMWTTQNGVYGNLFTASNGNTLFLPAAGYREGSGHNEADYQGYYWSNKLCTFDPIMAWAHDFGVGYGGGYRFRDHGYTVRPVRSSSQEMSFTINATAIPEMGGEVSGGGTYAEGTTCTLTATANEGYTFTNWTENSVVVSTEATYSFTVMGDRDLVANFAVSSGNNHSYVDLDLPSGTLWATCNVGANSPEEYGDYFAWGETAPKDTYDWSTYQYGIVIGDWEELKITKYCSNASWGYEGFTDNLTTLLSEDDAATANWGNGWRMPTKEEFQELYSNTTMTWTQQNGVNGSLFTASNGNSLFLPATGERWFDELYDIGSNGRYWASSLNTDYPGNAEYFIFNSDYYSVDYSSRDVGHTVRPVRENLSFATVTATANPAEGGTVSGGGAYEEGATCTLTATPNEGYTFVNWTENGEVVSSEATYSFTVTGNRDLVANFVEGNVCAITFDLDDSCGDSWNGNYLVVSYGDITEQLTLEDGSYASYALQIPDGSHVELTWISGSWIEECSFTVSYSNGNVIYQGSDLNDDFSYGFDVDCEEMPATTFDITASAVPEEGGTIEDTGEYDCGTECTLTAIPNQGYVFSNWTENGEVVSTDASYSFFVNGNRELVANFLSLSQLLVSISDDFNDGVINPDYWIASGPDIIEEDGMIKMQQNETDAYVALESVPLRIPSNNQIVIERSFLVHEQLYDSYWGEHYFYGSLNIRFNGSEDNFIGIGYNDDDYENRHGTYLMIKQDGEANETRICDATFDTWLEEKVVVDLSNETLTYYLSDTLVATLSIEGVSNQQMGYYTVWFNPYGWWTGHYHNMDYVNINTPSSDFYTIQATADPEEGGSTIVGKSISEFFDFEDQQIPSNWSNDTVYPWVITTTEYAGYNGSFCMMSGNGGVHSSTSSIEVTVDFVEDGTISFLAGCWGEGTSYVWDLCIFSIDNVARFTYGALQSWNSYSYGVTAGTHTFRWSYSKDGSVHPTGDAFFVDDVQFTGVFDGNPFYYGQTCTLIAEPNAGYSFVEWTKDGTPVSTNAIYTFAVTENADYVAHFYQLPTSLSDDFNDGEINPDLWIATGNNVYEEEGLLKMDQDVTDQNVSLLSKPLQLTPDNKIVVERSFYVHKNNNNYYGGFAIEFNGETGIHGRPLHADSWDGSITDEWGVDYIGVVYGHTTYDGKYGIYVENGIGNTIQGIRLCDVAFDTWQTEKVVIDLAAGLLSYYLNGAFVGTVDMPELTTLAVNYYTTIFSPWGWFTGHQQYMDYININTDLDATYTVTASANPAEGGTVSGGGTFQVGQTCTVTATVNEGYTFMYWTVNGNIVSYDAELSFPVALDCDLVANFSLPLTITAEADPTEGGTITGAGEFDYRTTCTLTAVANENYTFMYWTENGTQVSDTYEYSFTVTSDRNLVAHFSLPLTISASANLTGGGTVLGTGEYDYNTTCTLTATPNEGYLFLNWSKNGEVVSCNATYSFTVTEDADFEAVFMLLEGTLIGSGEQTEPRLPSYSYFNYTLSQQIYTSEEIGASGGITTISYFNAGETKTRSYDIYMVHTDKSTFESNTDWITVSEADRVFSGEVTMTKGYWTSIVLDTPFAYDGTSNLAIIIDDNSGNWTGSPHMACRVFNTNGNQAIFVYSDNSNYDSFNPSDYNGTLYSVKNQIILGISPVHFITAGNWSTASNWSNGALPRANNEVFIDAPCQLDQDATVAALTVSEGQSLTLQSGKTLTVTNTLTNTVTTGLVIEDGAQLVHASENVSATVKKNIAAHGTGIGKYRLISNPLASAINPELASVYHITKGNYDFYDWLATAPDHLEWRNFKDESFMMSPEGCGYLYANQNGMELRFPGVLKPSDIRYVKAVSYDSSDTEHPGWNLIGNPFMCNAYLVDANNEPLPYYRMNAAGDGFEAVTPGTAIAPMEGVFYQASGNGTVYFIRAN